MDRRLTNSDDAILLALGERLAQRRLRRDLTQQQLADEAGVSRRTVVRLEAGESTQLTNLVRVLRVLGLLDRLAELAPAPGPSPLQQLRNRGRTRKRASGNAPAPRRGGREKRS